jgi:hypothetical protein
LVNSLPNALQSLATGVTSSPTTGSTNLLSGLSLPQLGSLGLPAGLQTDLTNWDTIWSTFTGPYGEGLLSLPAGPFLNTLGIYGWGQNGQGLAAYLGGPQPITGALAPLTSGASVANPVLSSAGFGGVPVSAAVGKAALVGSLSVPQGWTEAAPAIRTLAAALPTTMAAAPAASLAGEGGVFSQMALSGLAGRAVAAAATRSGGGAVAGPLGGAVAAADPAAATIIVIPALEA